MEINPNIFKSYDIRGVYPEELNEETFFAVGRLLVERTGAKSVVMGQDSRLSCPALSRALAAGVLYAGAEIYDIGQMPTECVYFAVGAHDFPAGVIITASHNPKEYNGMKMVQKTGNNIEIIRGKDIASLVKLNGYDREKPLDIKKEDIWPDYINHILSFVDLSDILPMKIVVDASNGVGGLVISKIQDKLPVEIVPLNFTPNGNFPNHSPNPLEEGSAEKISEIIKEEKADFGIMFDGDADRIYLVDENGKMVRADATLLLLAKYFLEKNPGMAIAYNAICSKAVPKFVEEWGGKPVRTQVGFVFVREGLLKNNGIMGGELSGHYCFKDNYYMDSGMIAFLTLLQIISKDQRKVSEIIKELSPYAKAAESNFKIEDKNAVIEKIKQKYTDGKQDFLDGVTVEYKDWWFNVRPSNTEPLLRLTIEADTEKLLKEKQKELTDFISKN